MYIVTGGLRDRKRKRVRERTGSIIKTLTHIYIFD